MNCPNCNVTLVISDRQGIEIDYCPQCRGVWLDRGELDKIIERSAGYTRVQDTGDFNNAYKTDQRDYSAQPPHYSNDPKYRHKKKKGFLSDFFDFD
jgi:hypothetical protein